MIHILSFLIEWSQVARDCRQTETFQNFLLLWFKIFNKPCLKNSPSAVRLLLKWDRVCVYFRHDMSFGNYVVADQSRPRGIRRCTARHDGPTGISTVHGRALRGPRRRRRGRSWAFLLCVGPSHVSVIVKYGVPYNGPQSHAPEPSDFVSSDVRDDYKDLCMCHFLINFIDVQPVQS